VSRTFKQDYITLAPITPKGKWMVCARRAGGAGNERFAPIAECRTEGTADAIVKALDVLQGTVRDLEVPARKLADELRTRLTTVEKTNDALRADVRERDVNLRQCANEIANLQHELTIAKSPKMVTRAAAAE